MPVGNPTLVQMPSLKEVFDPNFLWFVKGKFYVPPQKMPPIPVRTQNGLIHPIGFVEANLAGTELK